MALGFKIADGYVEVHADYDKRDLRRAAQQAADDFGDDFGDDKAHDRAGREAGGRAAKSFSDDFIDTSKREFEQRLHRDGPLSPEAFNRNVDRNRSGFARVGRNVAARIRDGLVGPRGAGTAASAFGRSFIEAVTFGQADIGRGVSQKLMPKMAMAGTALGATLAGALILQLGNLITGGLPLVLGAVFAALPFFSIIREGMRKEDGKWKILNNEVGRTLRSLVDKFKIFKKTVSEPWRPTVLGTIHDLGLLLGRLQGPLTRIGEALAPAFREAMRGVFGFIESFVKAVGPAMPGIAAGLRQWGIELPKIGTALGGMISHILRNPEAVKQAVRDFSQFLQDAIEFGGQAASAITSVARAYGDFARFIDAREQSLGGSNLLLPKPATVRAQASGIVSAFNWLKTQIGLAISTLKVRLSEAWAGIGRGWEAVKVAWNAAVAFFRSIPGRVASALSTLKARVIIPFQQAHDAARAKVESLVARVVAFLKTLPGKAASAVSSLWSRMSGAFTRAATSARQKATDLVNRVIAFLRTLPGKAASAVSRLWGSMSGAFSSAASSARAAAGRLVSGFISSLRTIIGKARSAASSAKSAIVGVFSGAGSWLASAGRNIASGLASGIRGGLSWVTSAARSLASAAKSAAMSALGISSPSTVFAEEVGVPAAQGIAVGLRKQFPAEMMDLRKSMPQIRMPEAAMAGAGAAGGAGFSPTINVHVAPGFYDGNAAAKRALTKDVFLALEAYRKDYER